jgi:hypothetical protein
MGPRCGSGRDGSLATLAIEAVMRIMNAARSGVEGLKIGLIAEG